MFTIAETQDFERQWPQYWNEAEYDSFRVVYFMRNAIGKIVLLAIYAKATTANMTADKLKELRRDYEKINPPQR
jgi:hypothetical protein